MPGPRLVLLTFAVSACLAFTSSVSTQPKRAMSLVDLLNIPRVADPQLSPDGHRVTFMLSATDWPGNRRVPQIWQVNTDGTQLRRLTAHDAGAVSARWSPDGSAIAFLANGSVYVIPRDGGAPRQVSPRTGVAEFAWHPDGASIYYLASPPPTEEQRERQRRRGDLRVLDDTPKRQLWKMAVADGTETRITEATITSSPFESHRRAIASSSIEGPRRCRPTPIVWSCGSPRQTARVACD